MRSRCGQLFERFFHARNVFWVDLLPKMEIGPCAKQYCDV
jgi:hypothetical protein